MTHPQPPGGSPPPSSARLDGVAVELRPLAERVSERYYREYPDTGDRYGGAGRDWCVHDNLYLLAWAFGAHAGHVTFEEQVLWLSRVLASRDYPLDRLARDLEICADVVTGSAIGDITGQGSRVLGGGTNLEQLSAARIGGTQRPCDRPPSVRP